MIREALRDFRRTWPQLAVTDILARLAVVAVLTPAFALLLRVFLVRAENPALSDEEILAFFLRPLGLAMLVALAAAYACILFAEQAALMVVAFGATRDRAVSYLDALLHVARRLPRIARLGTLMFTRIAILAAPFLAGAAVVFAAFLSEHDINYYLAEKPPELLRAAALIGALLVVLLALLLCVAVGWFLALPSILVTDLSAKEALRASAAATRGRRLQIARWIVTWAAVSASFAALATVTLGFVTRELLRTEGRSLGFVLAGIALSLVATTVCNTVVSFAARATFALLGVRIHEKLADPALAGGAAIAGSGPLGERASFHTPRQLLVLGVLGIQVVVAALSLGVLHSVPVEDAVLVIAHRGGAIPAPENTLAAVRRGIADGADWIEIDVQESKDGVVVVAHDRDFMRKARDPRNVADLTASELAELDVGGWFGAEFADERVPTLAETLATCKGRVRLVIELKYYGKEAALEQRVIDLVEAADMRDEVALMSLSREGLDRARSLRPDWRYGYLSAVSVGDLTRTSVDFLAVTARRASRSFIRSAHARGCEVYVWTVNAPAQMSAMISRGVDGVITDDPALVHRVLRQRAEMSPIERLLLELGTTFGLLAETEETSEQADA